MVVGKLRDVDQALDAGQDLGEGAERDHLGDAADHDVALVRLVDHALPWVGLGLLEAERDALAIAVDVQHLDLHGLSDLEHLGGMVDVAPRELGDVDQAVDAVEVDERAEVDDVRDHALHLGTGREPIEDLLALLASLLLEHGTARQHDVVAAAVELDHLAANAEVDDQTALDDLDHSALDRLAALGGRLDPAPRLLEPGALLRQDQTPVGVLLLQHQSVDLVADRDLFVRVDRPADRELRDRDDALALVADVDQDLVLVDTDDRAADHVALAEVGQRAVVVGDELAVHLDHPGVVIHGRVGVLLVG